MEHIPDADSGEVIPPDAEQGMELPNEPFGEDEGLLDEPANEESYEEMVFDEDED